MWFAFFVVLWDQSSEFMEVKSMGSCPSNLEGQVSQINKALFVNSMGLAPSKLWAQVSQICRFKYLKSKILLISICGLVSLQTKGSEVAFINNP